MAAAYLDSQLTELLRRSFVDDPSIADELLGQSKPLGTFSSRIDLAYALGLIEKSVHRDLHLIRKIRNDFGHVPTPIEFDHPPIAGRCRELTHIYYEPDVSPRKRFLNTVMGVLASVHSAEYQTHYASPVGYSGAVRSVGSFGGGRSSGFSGGGRSLESDSSLSVYTDATATNSPAKLFYRARQH
jgi:DNA-binding MltR family transcriptional regulator